MKYPGQGFCSISEIFSEFEKSYFTWVVLSSSASPLFLNDHVFENKAFNIHAVYTWFELLTYSLPKRKKILTLKLRETMIQRYSFLQNYNFLWNSSAVIMLEAKGTFWLTTGSWEWKDLVFFCLILVSWLELTRVLYRSERLVSGPDPAGCSGKLDFLYFFLLPLRAAGLMMSGTGERTETEGGQREWWRWCPVDALWGFPWPSFLK